MSVYVDPLFDTAGLPRAKGGRWAYAQACHMDADTHEELEAMARRLGLKPEWIQHRGRMTEHYDLVPSKRAQAVRYGAVELSMAEVIERTKAKLAAKRQEATS